MKIVIDMPEKTVNEIKDNAMFACIIQSEILWDVTSAIVNGTPLHKGHGRLIDVSEYYDGSFNDAREFLDNATTIIEADKAESEE